MGLPRFYPPMRAEFRTGGAMRDRLLTQIQAYMERSFPASANTVTLTRDAYDQLASTVGTLPPESGAVIGGPADRPALISQVWFDGQAGSGNFFYTPTPRDLEATVAQWEGQHCRFRGIVHSHGPGYRALSPTDIESGTLFMEANGLSQILLGLFCEGELLMFRLTARNLTPEPLSVTVISVV